MAWNPSPSVKIARQFGQMFEFDKVYIIGVNADKQIFRITSYGDTKKKCDEAKKHADIIHNQIQNGTIKISD